MQKRILSLLLVACMMLSIVPVMAIVALAEEAVVNPATSTNFSYDVTNPNFPTLNLPEATDATDPKHITLGKYDFSGLGNSTSDLITYNNNWELGSLLITYDAATDTFAYDTAFSAYTNIIRPSHSELAITDGGGTTWGSTSAPSGGGLFLAGGLTATLTAPIDYNKTTATDDAPNSDPRNFKSYEATTSVRYTAEYTGTVSIDAVLGFAWDNGVDLVILHNGVLVGTVENNDPEKTVGTGAANTANHDYGTVVSDLAVMQGDTIDFVMRGDPKYDYAHVGETFNYNYTKRGARNFSFTVNYAEGWTFIDYDELYVISSWDQADPSCLTVTGNAQGQALRGVIETFYKWYAADGSALDYDTADPSLALQDDSYAMINETLYELGVLTEGMSWDEMWESYGEYLANTGKITYGNGWSIGNIVNGVYYEVTNRAYMYNQSVYAVRIGYSAGGPIYTADWDNQFAAPIETVQFYIDQMVTMGKASVQPGEDGKLTFAEIKGVFDVEGEGKVSNYNWNSNHGGIGISGGVYGIRPAPDAPTALQYTVGEGVYGTAHIDLNEYLGFINNETDAWFCVTVNDEVVWPAGASADDQTTWYVIDANTSATELSATLEAVEFDVRAGDRIQMRFARGATGGKKIHINIKPTIMIEKKHIVEFTDENGELLLSKVVKPGAPMPSAPLASAGGFYINDSTEAVTTLPETVEGNTFIQYAGSFVIKDVSVDKASISVADDFSVNLYLKGDPYAVKVGLVAGDGVDTWGVKQDDGTFKVTIPGIAAKDLDNAIDVWMFQEFEGGKEGYNIDAYVLKATDILQTYVEDAAYADVKDLAAAAIDYAAAASEYFEGKALASDVAARLAAQDAAIAALSKDVVVEDEYYDYSISAATLVLKNQVAIKIQANLTEFDVLDDEILDFTVEVEDENGNVVPCEGFTYLVGSEFGGVPTGVVLTLNAINAADYDAVYEITIYDGMDQASATVSYGVNTYIARTFEGGAGETDNLLRALYAFGVAAEAYNA